MLDHNGKLQRDAENVLTWVDSGSDPLVFGHLLRFAKEIQRLMRARDVAINHLAKGDIKGALAALTMQRYHPDLFDQSIFEGE